MITFRRSLLIPVLLAILPFFVSFTHAAQEIRFSWAMLVDTPSGVTTLDFTTPPVVHENSTLQLYLHPDKTTYIYIFLLDSSNYFSPIFPGMKNYYDYYPPGTPIRIPAGEDRFTTLPPAGQEKFYLLASAKRLVAVEELLEECLNKPDDIESQARLFQEIRSLRRSHSKMTQFTEMGMPVSGTRRSLNKTRGAEMVDSFVATHVVGEGFYSRILRLNHE